MAEAGNQEHIRFKTKTEILLVPKSGWRMLDRLSYEGDPDSQAALDRFLQDIKAYQLSTNYSNNLVTTAGKNHVGSSALPNGSWYVLQKGDGAIDVSDTMLSHSGWVELSTYTQSTRPALTLGTWTAGSANNASNKALFTAPAAGLTFYGWGIVNSNTKLGTTGILFSAADHSSPQVVAAGGVLRQTLTGTVS